MDGLLYSKDVDLRVQDALRVLAGNVRDMEATDFGTLDQGDDLVHLLQRLARTTLLMLASFIAEIGFVCLND